MPGFLKGNRDTIFWASILPLLTHISQIIYTYTRKLHPLLHRPAYHHPEIRFFPRRACWQPGCPWWKDFCKHTANELLSPWWLNGLGWRWRVESPVMVWPSKLCLSFFLFCSLSLTSQAGLSTCSLLSPPVLSYPFPKSIASTSFSSLYPYFIAWKILTMAQMFSKMLYTWLYFTWNPSNSPKCL